MLGDLRRLGVEDEAVLSVMERVPRHHFVEHFWNTPADEPWTRSHMREHVVDEEASDDVLDAVHSADAALATQLSVEQGGHGASSISAPIIVAMMLAEMRLQPGQRILEIGAGSGYNAALLAELVGDAALVTSIDIDSGLVARAKERLIREGYGGVEVRAGDGALGAPDRAPFDWIVATVGCLDLAPAWVDQLAPHGRMLIPLEHGAMHPRIEVTRDDPEASLRGTFVGRSAFLRMRGSQAQHTIWRTDTSLKRRHRRIALPAQLRHALERSTDRAHPLRGHWDLSTYLAIRDRRAVGTIGLAEGTSAAFLVTDHFRAEGPEGANLAQQIIELGLDWIRIGQPAVESYALEFVPLTEGTRPLPSSAEGPWALDRIDYRETVTLR